MNNSGRCYLQNIHGGPTSADLEDAIRCAELKIQEAAAHRERLLAELYNVERAITYQEAARAKHTAELAAQLAPKELHCGCDLDQKMLDDLVAQRAAITLRIRDLEAERAR